MSPAAAAQPCADRPVTLVNVAPPVVTVAPSLVGQDGSEAALVPAVVQRNTHLALSAGAIGFTNWPTVYAVEIAKAGIEA